MNTKLTRTIEQTLIEKAKVYAKGKRRSLYDIVENYFIAIVKEEGIVKSESTTIADSLRGSFKAPKDFDYKKELTKSLIEKYLQNGKVELILTKNLKDYKNSELDIFTSET